MVGSVLPILIGVLVVVAVAGLVVLVIGVVVARRMRRRWRTLRAHAGFRSVVALAGAWREPDSGGGTPRRWRAELWRAVAAATRAVRHAEAASGTLAELPGLSRRLRQSAEELDRLLSSASGLDASTPELVTLHHQVDDARAAAATIQRAALASASDATAMRLDALTEDAGREVASVSAGVARSRSAFGGR